MPSFCYVILTIFIRKEDDGRWTAECKELGTATFGNSFEEAQEALEEAVELHLNTLESVGVRDRFFKENGIRLYQREFRKRKIEITNDPNVFVSSYRKTIEACACP